MASNPLNFKKNHADVVAAETAIAPFLKAANITSILVDGKEVPAAEAPLAAKVTALGKVLATGDKTEDSAAAIKANGELAAQLEAAEAKIVTLNATISSQTQQINNLTANLTVATDSVATLTARNTELGTLLKAATDESIRLTGEINTFRTGLAQDCIDAQCLDVKDLDSALKISTKDLRTAYKGAVNAAISRTGAAVGNLPNAAGTATGTTSPKLTRAEFEQLNPKAQTDFFKRGGKIVA